MKAVIVNIGYELLNGKTLNTDFHYIAKKLNALGYDVIENVVVGDHYSLLKNELQRALNISDIVITTGGLGPTYDDITKNVIAEVLKEPLKLNQEALNSMRQYFLDINKEMTEPNLRQAYIPNTSNIIVNNNGTAPGIVIEKNDKIVIALPGPPQELMPMFEESVEEFLKSKNDTLVHYKDYLVMGIGESDAELKLQNLYGKYNNVYIAPYAETGKIRYRISSYKKDDNLEEFLNAENEFLLIMSDFVVGEYAKDIEGFIVEELKRLHYKISFAESCTGGLVVSRLVNYPSASSVLNESYVTYSNGSKEKILGVNKETIKQYGAVSEQTAKEMVEGLFNITKSQVCLSVTGIAGPTGGTDVKPVGLVWFGLKIHNKTVTFDKTFKGNRAKIRERATLYALWYIYNKIKLL